ncbi:MAG TPA: helix-turn-helix domain-containing protein [Chloroflexota bacterium]|jgi:DNA-binding HxlR family transcriptional regulator
MRKPPSEPAAPDPSARRSPCPVACALDLVGDRWTLLLVRDLLAGKTRFNELRASPEKIPSNILADRLKRLERGGILTAVPYERRPLRVQYLLTPKGRALGRVLQALATWGLEYLPGTSWSH